MRSGCKGCTQNSRRRCVGKWAGRGPPKSARAPQRLQGPGTAWAVPPSVGPHPGAAATGQGTAPRVSKARPRCLARRPRRSLQINAGRRPDLTEDGAQRWASAVPPARSAMRNSGSHGLGTRGAMDSELRKPWSAGLAAPRCPVPAGPAGPTPSRPRCSDGFAARAPWRESLSVPAAPRAAAPRGGAQARARDAPGRRAMAAAALNVSGSRVQARDSDGRGSPGKARQAVAVTGKAQQAEAGGLSSPPGPAARPRSTAGTVGYLF